jgi:hypothetical protein
MTSLRAEPIPVNGRRVEKILDLYHGVTNAKGLAERFESGSAACGVAIQQGSAVGGSQAPVVNNW